MIPTYNFDEQNFYELIVARFHRRNIKRETFSRENFDEWVLFINDEAV